MRPLALIPIFLLAVILVVPVSYAATPSDLVPLDWRSNNELIPGHKIEVWLKAEGARYPYGAYSFAGAGVSLDDYYFAIVAEEPGWGGLGDFPVYFRVFNGDTLVKSVKIGSIGLSEKKDFEATLTAYMDCSGHIVVNTPVGVVEWDDQDKTADIRLYFTHQGDLLHPDVWSNATVTSDEVIQDCNYDGPGQPPVVQNPSNTKNNDKDPLDLNTIIKYSFGLIGVVAVLAVIVSRGR